MYTPQVVVIDNYDSFTYNLVHLVRQLGAQVTVLRNDQFVLEIGRASCRERV